MNLVCSKCLGVNRVPDERIVDNPKCGKCKQSLISEDVVEANQALFNKFVANSGLPVVVDFWASWCGPCQAMAPTFSQLAKEMKGKCIFLKVNTENEQELATRFAIRSIPSLKIFKGGKVAADTAGALPKSQLQAFISPHI
jgi:thioredoxin 2